MAKLKQKKSTYTAQDFFLEDLPRTLFPLTTNKILVEKGSAELIEFAENLIADGGSFLPQRRVYANKDNLHLRRTAKLDAVAEFYLYHLVFKNRSKFRKPHTKKRKHFGYRFDNGRPVAPSRSYAEFKSAVWQNNLFYEEFIYFDVASYFNSAYQTI